MRMSWRTLKPGHEGYDAAIKAMRDIKHANEEAAEFSRLADEYKKSAEELALTKPRGWMKLRAEFLNDVAFCEDYARQLRVLSVHCEEQLSRLVKGR